MKLVDFWVPNKPRPKGSWTPIPLCVRHGNPRCTTCTVGGGKDGGVGDGVRVFLDGGEALSEWARRVAEVAGDAYRRVSDLGTPPWAGPVDVETRFLFARPARCGEDFPVIPSIGDGDKLVRAVWDALVIGRGLVDDRQVVDWLGGKRWALPGMPAGVLVSVRTAEL